MKLKLERSGGFAGLTKSITVDTEDLPTEMVTNIKRYMTSRKSLKSSHTINKKNRVYDSYFYRISGQFGEKKREIEFNEFDIDKETKAILNYIFKKY